MDPPKILQQFSGKTENGSQTPSSLSLLSVYSMIIPLLTYLPVSVPPILKQVKTFLLSCESSLLHKHPCLSMGCFSLPSRALFKGEVPVFPNAGFPSVLLENPFIITVCGLPVYKNQIPCIYLVQGKSTMIQFSLWKYSQTLF